MIMMMMSGNHVKREASHQAGYTTESRGIRVRTHLMDLNEAGEQIPD